MAFWGKRFNVLLVTGHSPLRKLIDVLNEEHLKNALSAAEKFRSLLGKNKSAKPIALVGLNPHAGGKRIDW